MLKSLDCNKSVDSRQIKDKEQTELMDAVSQYIWGIPPTDGVALFLRHRYSLPAWNDALVLKGADRAI